MLFDGLIYQNSQNLLNDESLEMNVAISRKHSGVNISAKTRLTEFRKRKSNVAISLRAMTHHLRKYEFLLLSLYYHLHAIILSAQHSIYYGEVISEGVFIFASCLRLGGIQ